MSISLPNRCTYREMDNGIHEFIIHEASRAAADDMAAHIDNILQVTSVTAPAPCYLVDNSQVAALPLSYLRNRIKTVNTSRAADGRPPGRIAILYDGTLGSVANMMLRVTVPNQVRIFGSTERSAAIDWLLRDTDLAG
jgi:hypothetical protein